MTVRGHGKSIFSGAALQRIMQDLLNQPIENLILSESRAFGAKYYCVEPVGGNWLEMESWCTKTFGNAATMWDSNVPGRWYMNSRRFWFRNEQDRTVFVLKWL